MSGTIHAQLHQDHTRWEQEAALWRDDVAVWQRELERAHSDMHRLTETFRAQTAALNAHLTMLEHQVAGFRTHEHALVGYEKGGAGEELPAMAGEHDHEATQQAAVRQVHERIKRQHHEMLAHWNLLLKAIVKPM